MSFFVQNFIMFNNKKNNVSILSVFVGMEYFDEKSFWLEFKLECFDPRLS